MGYNILTVCVRSNKLKIFRQKEDCGQIIFFLKKHCLLSQKMQAEPKAVKDRHAAHSTTP
jgi:hypothetical protein